MSDTLLEGRSSPLAIGDLPALLDGAAGADLLRHAGLDVTAVSVDYLRLKPDRSALAACTLTGPAGTEVPAYVRTFRGDEATTIAGKWRGRAVDTPLGPGVALLPGGRSVLFQFPNDGHLRRLADLATIDRGRRLLAGAPGLAGWRIRGRRSTLRPVRWKPERRYVAAADLGLADDSTGERSRASVHLRWFPDGRGAALADLAGSLWRAGVPAPTPLGAAADGRLYVERSAPGRDGAEALTAGQLDAASVLDLLERLRRAPAAGLGCRPLRSPTASARTALASLAEVVPHLQPLITDVTRLLPADPAAPTAVLAHGDLHLHQLLATPEQVTVVDLERAGVGDDLVDVASLLAHALELAATNRSDAGVHPAAAFVAAVADAELRRSGRRGPDLAVLLRAALVERALLAFRHLQPGWPEQVEALLRRAAGSTADGSWEVLHPRPSGLWTGWRRGDAGRQVAGVFEPVTAVFVDRAEDDPALPGLAAWSARAELVGHRPGRRAVLRHGASFVKVVRPRRVEPLVSGHAAVAAAAERSPGVPASPALELVDRAAGVVVLSRVPGLPLHEVLMGGDHHERRAALTQVAGALRAVRGVDAGDLGLGAAADGGDLDRWLEVVTAHAPVDAGAYRAVHAGLPAPAVSTPPGGAPGSSPMRASLVHGDLHDRNLLLDGPRTGWIDLDAAGVGDPSIDAGNLAAHVVLRALQRAGAPGRRAVADGRAAAEAFLEACGEGFPQSRAWTARTLFRLACLYPFRRRWAHLAPGLLDQSACWSG